MGGEGLGVRGESGMAKRRNPEAIAFARFQRATANEFARDVWQILRNRRCCREKFRREYSIRPFTVDFRCVALKLIVEVDGETLFTEKGKQQDQRRDHYLRELGYEVLRIPGYDVLRDPLEVRERIESAIVRRRNG